MAVILKNRLLHPQQKPGLGSEIDWGHPLARGLVGCWLFNEGAGSVVQDIAGRNHGKLINFKGTATSGWTPSACGTALAFDGSNNCCVEIPHSPILNVSNGLTVIALAQPISDLSYRDIVSKEDSDYSCGWEMVNNSGSLRCVIRGPDLDRQYPAFPVGTWCQTTMMYDMAKLSQGLNGKLSAVGTGVSSPNSTGPLCVGKRTGGGYNNSFFMGLISFVSIYNRALSPDEVRWFYQEPYAMIRPAGPMRRYYIPVSLSKTDSLTVAAAEGATGLLGSLARTDGVSIGITEGTTGLLGSLARIDGLSIGVTEEDLALAAFLDRADALGMSVSETTAILAVLDTFDMIDLTVTDVVQLVSAMRSCADVLNISVTDVVNKIRALSPRVINPSAAFAAVAGLQSDTMHAADGISQPLGDSTAFDSGQKG
jgi:hypothetical protein